MDKDKDMMTPDSAGRETLADVYTEVLESEISQSDSTADSTEDYTGGINPIIDPATITQLSVAGKRAETFPFPVDKVNFGLWGMDANMLEAGTIDNPIKLKAEPDKSKKEVSLLLSVNFDDLKGVTMTRELTHYDRLVYGAISALLLAGNECMTESQIHAAMGNNSRPAPHQIEKIHDSVTKMSGTRIYLSNSEERAAKYKYEPYEYDGHLLPMERITARINGKVTEAAIHLLREPPLTEFAKGRGQITSIPRKLLESPGKKTETSIMIEHYLLTRISRMKNTAKNKAKTKPNKRILFETLYEYGNINKRYAKTRAKNAMTDLLDFYKKEEFITGYKVDGRGVTIDL